MKAIFGAFHWNFACKDGLHSPQRPNSPNSVGIDHIHDYVDESLWEKKKITKLAHVGLLSVFTVMVNSLLWSNIFSEWNIPGNYNFVYYLN